MLDFLIMHLRSPHTRSNCRSIDMMDSCSRSSFFVRMFVLKCYCISDSCLIFVGSLHFGGCVDTMEDLIWVRILRHVATRFRRPLGRRENRRLSEAHLENVDRPSD